MASPQRSGEHKSLEGCQVILTRAAHQQTKARELLETRGAEVLSLPSIEFAPPPSRDDSLYHQADQWIHYLDASPLLSSIDWVIFTSANAVRFAESCWREWGGLNQVLHEGNSSSSESNPSAMAHPALLCVGSSTQRALREYVHLPVERPDEFTAEGILRYLEEHDLQGKEIIIPRALIARELLPTTLRERGARVRVCPVYQTRGAEISPQSLHDLGEPPPAGSIRYLTFTSDSTLHHLVAQLHPSILAQVKTHTRIAAIGPVVKQAIEGMGLHADVVADPHSLSGLISAIERDYQALQKGRETTN